MRGIHQWPLDSPITGAVTRKMILFKDVEKGKISNNSAIAIYVVKCKRMYTFPKPISMLYADIANRMWARSITSHCHKFLVSDGRGWDHMNPSVKFKLTVSF